MWAPPEATIASDIYRPEERGPVESDRGDHSLNMELFIPLRSDSGLPLRCAQELFSLFILAITSNIEKVLGTTTYEWDAANMDREMSRKARRWDNSIFSMIANEVVNGGLAHDAAEAYTLIVPAFAKYRILPTETRMEDLPSDTTQL